MVAENGPLSNC